MVLDLTVPEIRRSLQAANAQQFATLERSLAADTRKGVRDAIEVARRRLQREEAERQRLGRMYDFERELADTHDATIVVGLDEVGRGPLAGPLTMGAVVLDPDDHIEGLNDSKQLKPDQREKIAEQVKSRAVAWSVQHIPPEDIDAAGMMACLATGFRRCIATIEQSGVTPDIVLLDGNPIHMDFREVNVVKGDGKCASIAAASIIAKVDRDAYMASLDDTYPEYGFALNKGYASSDHIEAIKQHGLTPVHRASFCAAFTQPTLF